MAQIAIVYPQVVPVLSRPRSVERPESVKYCPIGELNVKMRGFRDAYEGEENDRNRVFEFLSQCDGEVTLSWDDEPDDESACGTLSDSMAG